MAKIQISMYIPEKILDKADAMQGILRRIPEYEHMSEMNRSEVLRIALSEGIRVLETKLEESRQRKLDP